MTNLQDDLREIELIGWYTRDCIRSRQTYEHTKKRDGEHHATRPKRGEARKIRAREARNPEHHLPELERQQAEAKAERNAAEETNAPKRRAKKPVQKSFTGVQQFDGFEPVINWPADPVKDTSYQHTPLQPATHLWADLITASDADQRRGNVRKGG